MVSAGHPFEGRELEGSIRVEREDQQTVLRLAGEIDMEVVEQVEDLNDWRPPVVDAIDAGGVTFLSSIGVGYLIRVLERSRAQGRSAVLRSVSPSAERVFARTGLTEMFGLSE